MFYNTHQKELLDQKYLVACDFMTRDIVLYQNDANKK